MALPAGYKTVSNNFKVDSNDRLLMSSGTGAKPTGAVPLPGELWGDGDGRLLVNGGETIISPSGADDSVALQALIADGADILLGPGTFLLNTAPISLPKNLNGLRLRGSGKGLTTIKLSAGAPRAFDFNRTADYDTFQNIELGNFTVDANNLSSGRHHTLIGNFQAGTSQARLNYQNLYLHDIDVVNVYTGLTDGTNYRFGVQLASTQSAPGETQTFIQKIRFERVRIYGGNNGFDVVGNGGGSASGYTQFIDDITFVDCVHDTGVIPTAPLVVGSLNFQVGSGGFGGRLRMVNCYGKGSADVGVEIDNMDDVEVYGTTVEEHGGNGFHITNFNWPARGGGSAPSAGNNTLNAQRMLIDGCHSRRQSTFIGSGSRGFNLVQNNSIGFGRLHIRGCTYYRGGATTGALWTAGEGLYIGCPTNVGHRVEGFEGVIENVDVPAGTGDITSGSLTIANATGTWYKGAPIAAGANLAANTYVTNVSGSNLTLSANATGNATGTAITAPTGQTPSMIYVANGAHTSTGLRDITCKLSANFQSGASATSWRYIELGGGSAALSTILDADNIGIDHSFTGTGATTQSIRALIAGNQAATLSGSIKGMRILNWTGGGTNQAILFGAAANLTIPAGKVIEIRGCDFNNAALSTPAINFTATSVAPAIRLRDNVYQGGDGTISIASAAALTIPDANVIYITGTNAITSISALRQQAVVTFKFAGSLTFTTGATLKLAGAANFPATADDTITLTCDGTNWQEIARSNNA